MHYITFYPYIKLEAELL